MKSNIQKKQVGVGLIEVLVTLVILTLGVVGMLRMQTGALQTNNSAIFHTTAIDLASSWIEQMHSYAPALASDPSACVNTTKNAPQNSCQAALNEWQQQVARMLPEGEVQVQRSKPNGAHVQVWVRWLDQRAGVQTSRSETQKKREIHLISQLY